MKRTTQGGIERKCSNKSVKAANQKSAPSPLSPSSFPSCPVVSNEQTLSVLRNGQGPEAMFRIQMFKFVGGSYTNVFLHCNVQICHNAPGLCQPVSELVQCPFL